MREKNVVLKNLREEKGTVNWKLESEKCESEKRGSEILD